MYHSVEEFLNDWKIESEKTIQIFSSIPEEKKSVRFNDQLRSMERLSWHIVQNLSETMSKVKLLEQDTLEDQKIPDSLKEIIADYKNLSDLLVELMLKKWKDSDLQKKVIAFNKEWTANAILDILIKHQIHHRGQLTILIRLSNSIPVGIYGPNKEDWKKFGMEVRE